LLIHFNLAYLAMLWGSKKPVLRVGLAKILKSRIVTLRGPARMGAVTYLIGKVGGRDKIILKTER